MRKLLLTCCIVIVAALATITTYAESTNQKQSTKARGDVVIIEEDVWVPLLDEPFDQFHQAHESFFKANMYFTNVPNSGIVSPILGETTDV